MKTLLKNTYRQILKWGDPNYNEELTDDVKKTIQELVGIPISEVNLPTFLPGEKEVTIEKEIQLAPKYVKEFTEIVGAENIKTSDFDRAKHAAGKFYGELMELRQGKVTAPPDIVVSPNDESQVDLIVQKCNEWKIAICPQGLRSSVTKGIGLPDGGIALDLTKHLNQIIQLDEESLTVTAQAGISGPALEKFLNQKGYTCGHFPQSFEFSTLGGWIAAKGAGQCSTGYGKIEDMVLSIKAITPTGIIENESYPKAAQGWEIMPLFIGAEGTLGVITQATIKIRKFELKNRRNACIIFKDFENAQEAMKACIQGQFGLPHLFRISDHEETEVAFRMKGFEGTFSDKALQAIGYKPNSRSLMFISVEGDKDYTSFVVDKIKSTAKKFGGRSIGSRPTKNWLSQRFHSAYMREPLMDLGLMTDTIETSVLWKDLKKLWKNVRTYVKSRPKTVCMCHISHVYENGANLYFTFISPTDKSAPLEDYQQFHEGLVNTILSNNGSLSHHHGIGRALSPWLKEKVGENNHNLMKNIKSIIDPNGIMNPGSVLN
ncbi:FAD-binding oxidoreductase [Flammeovirga sp. EKP202]|uniref:FAD-binding oxidoreductase n=1 Tax=Flammeovirga sp. EKP202 TaxID=2770592 RepID=UPI00165FD743|nr:FAD-binding oxidoreductase [Flammeovirga sp. EKP202]MBD0400358.1 FAD-binding oxidoreductase [Flammeovirga sp. EKP202]